MYIAHVTTSTSLPYLKYTYTISIVISKQFTIAKQRQLHSEGIVTVRHQLWAWLKALSYHLQSIEIDRKIVGLNNEIHVKTKSNDILLDSLVYSAIQ